MSALGRKQPLADGPVTAKPGHSFFLEYGGIPERLAPFDVNGSAFSGVRPTWHSGCQRLGLRDSTTTHIGTARARPLQRLVGRRLASGSALRALEPEGLGRTSVPPLEALNVFDVRLATDGEARSLKPAHAELHSIEGHDLDSLFAQVFNEPGETEHPLRNLCLELRFAGENDNRLDGVGR